jgi:hypothetical protein
VETFCFTLLEKEQQGTLEQETRWVDNAERMVDIATRQIESLERIFRVLGATSKTDVA